MPSKHTTPKRRRQNYIAMYGNVVIEKAWCTDCDGYSFIVDGRLVCCNARPTGLPVRYKRESEPEARRAPLSEGMKLAKLEEQDHRCYYCNRPFDSIVYRKGKPVRLQIHYDHMVPYSYSQNNDSGNFVAACHVCNGIKSDLCFSTQEEAQIYILNRWEQKGYV